MPAIVFSLATLWKLSRLSLGAQVIYLVDMRLKAAPTANNVVAELVGVHPSCHQPDVVHGWLQVAAIEATVSESDIFSSFALCHSGARVYGWLQVAAIGTAVPETDIFAC